MINKLILNLNGVDKHMITEKLEIIEATAEHCHEISLLAQETFTETFGPLFPPDVLQRYLMATFHPDKLKSSLSKPDNQFFLAYDGREPVGYAKLKANSRNQAIQASNQMQLQKIYFLSKCHGKQFGAAMMDVCLKYFRQCAPVTVWLDVLETNAKAIRFYQKFGFEAVGKDHFNFETANFRFDIMSLEL